MSVRIDVHHHGLGHPDVIEQHLKLIYDRVVGLGLQGAELMAKVDEMLADLQKANTDTNEIASDLNDLISRLAAGGLSPDEATQVSAQIVMLRDRLTSVAAQYTPPAPPA